MKLRLWPKSLLGQMLLAVALALLVAQSISTVLLVRAQEQRNEWRTINTAAFRLAYADRINGERVNGRRDDRRIDRRGDGPSRPGGMRLERSAQSPITPTETRNPAREASLREILNEQGVQPAALLVTTRRTGDDAVARNMFGRLRNNRAIGTINGGNNGRNARDFADRPLLVAAMQRETGGQWVTTRVPFPGPEPRALGGIIGQTLLIYLVLVGGLALLLRRITRPLAALTGRVEHFAETRQADGQLEPAGPEDTRRLIEAHNKMEAGIAALLDEKDVMLGAIGHDLKTPLAALRVRIESVENETERQRMAATIEDITRSLDDILSLARVGRSTDPVEPTELAALTASVVEEFEDMGENVELGETMRLVIPARTTWLRRALRNLIGNALRYGNRARVSLEKQGGQAVIIIEDDGPGIAQEDIARMMEPFTRGDPSRNKSTGGAGLGLTLARAIAEQHGGRLVLTNRATGGLSARIYLPCGE